MADLTNSGLTAQAGVDVFCACLPVFVVTLVVESGVMCAVVGMMCTAELF